MNNLQILQLHSNYIEYKPIQKEIDIAEEVEKKERRIEEVVVLFTAVEEGDNETVARQAVKEVQDFLEKLKVNKALIYPYAHLSSDLAKPLAALRVVKAMENPIVAIFDLADEVSDEAPQINKMFKYAAVFIAIWALPVALLIIIYIWIEFQSQV